MKNELIIMSDLVQDVMIDSIINFLKKAQKEGYTTVSIKEDFLGHSTYIVLVAKKGKKDVGK